jgi:bacteriocin biosynthesis cyclodehydratase domain-containing protein
MPRRHTVAMVLRLDPRYPVVWRTPSSVQLGVDPAAVVLEGISELQERMLAALAVGVSQPGLAMLSRGRDAERDALLETLAPVLAVPEAAANLPVVAISGVESISGVIVRVLAESGVQVIAGSEAGDLRDARPHLAIATGHFVLDPELHAFWLRRDVPHLPIVLSDTAMTIGPFVEPGAGPCLLCLELHRRDADAAWPVVAAQLLGRRSRAESAVLLAETAGAAGRMVLARLSAGAGAAASLRIDATTGIRTWRTWSAHPECGCRGIEVLERSSFSPGRPGTGWADAARGTAGHSLTS